MTSSPSPTSRPSSVWSRPLLLGMGLTAIGCSLAYWLIGSPPLVGAEDAAIGFRYARNLAEGHGIVFNPGGEHVEGFTSLSWLFISAAVYRMFGAINLEAVLLLLSVAMTVITLTITLRLLDRTGAGAAAIPVAVAWLIGQSGFYFWSGLSLMDVAPWAMGLALLVLLVDTRLTEESVRLGARIGLACVVVFLMLTRPEAMLVVPGSVAVAAIAYGFSSRLRTLAFEVVGTSVAVAVGLTAFRLSYFGVPLPNTYYVKVSPDVLWRLGRGFAYVGEYIRAHSLSWGAFGVIAGLLVVHVAALRARSSPRDTSETGEVGVAGAAGQMGGVGETRGTRLAVFVAGFIILGFASVIYGGGDHYQGHRFLQSYLPLAAVPFAFGLTLAITRSDDFGKIGPNITMALVAGVTFLMVPIEWTTYRDHGLRQQAMDVGLQGRFVGQTLDDAFAGGPRPELGLWMVGGASYTYHGPVKDLLGLNWIAMGMSEGDRKGPRDHAAFNLDVFWSDPPELMVPEPEAVLGPQRCVRSVFGSAFGGLLTTDRFLAEFEPVRIQRGEGVPIIAYARSDWMPLAPPAVQALGWEHCATSP